MPAKSAGVFAGGGRVTLAKPTLTHHTSTGQFRITNYDALYTYSLSVTAGSATRSGDIITLTDANSVCTVNVAYGKALPASPATCERKAYTYTAGQSCSDNCASAYYWPSGCGGPNCCNANNNCWGAGTDGYCAADGTICCGGSRGQTCTPTSTKDATPSGYTDSYSEWWKVT